MCSRSHHLLHFCLSCRNRKRRVVETKPHAQVSLPPYRLLLYSNEIHQQLDQLLVQRSSKLPLESTRVDSDNHCSLNSSNTVSNTVLWCVFLRNTECYKIFLRWTEEYYVTALFGDLLVSKQASNGSVSLSRFRENWLFAMPKSRLRIFVIFNVSFTNLPHSSFCFFNLGNFSTTF